MTNKPKPCKKCSGSGYYKLLTVEISCYHCNESGWEPVCNVCGGIVYPDADKYHPKKPVYDGEEGGMYHLDCEDEIFDEVHCSIYD